MSPINQLNAITVDRERCEQIERRNFESKIEFVNAIRYLKE